MYIFYNFISIYNMVHRHLHFGVGSLHVPSDLHVALHGPSRAHPACGTHLTVVDVHFVDPHDI